MLSFAIEHGLKMYRYGLLFSVRLLALQTKPFQGIFTIIFGIILLAPQFGISEILGNSVIACPTAVTFVFSSRATLQRIPRTGTIVSFEPNSKEQPNHYLLRTCQTSGHFSDRARAVATKFFGLEIHPLNYGQTSACRQQRKPIPAKRS